MSIVKHIPNTITSMNLLSGIMGVICTMLGLMAPAFLFMLAAAVFDFCDGLAARLLKAYSPIGKELDSLSDMVSFGVLPGLMLHQTMWRCGMEAWPSYITLFMPVMAALRLAKFNVDERQTTDFLGVATPTTALLSGALCTYVAARPESFLAAWAGTSWFLPALAVVLGLLLVSEIPMFGMKIAKGHKLLDAKRIVFLCLALAAIVFVAVAGLNWSLAVLLIFCLYILLNLVVRLFKR
jgi:CDP-diacylglycerol--serine O-phosphatidyltransferase